MTNLRKFLPLSCLLSYAMAVRHDHGGDIQAASLDDYQCLPDATIGMEMTFTSAVIIKPEAEFEAAIETIEDSALQDAAKMYMNDGHMGALWGKYGKFGFAAGMAATMDDSRISDHFKHIKFNEKETKIWAMQDFKKAVEAVCAQHGCKVSVPWKRTFYTNTDGSFVPFPTDDTNHIPNASPTLYVKFRVDYPDGWWWQAICDSWVLEVNAEPTTEAYLMAHKQMLQEHIWETAAAANLAPHSRIGNGHIHMDFKSTFGDDKYSAAALRNFIVDFENHPTFPLSVFGDIRDNAPPLAILKQETRDAFGKSIRQFDQKAWANVDYMDFAEKINQVILGDTYMNGEDGLPNWAWRARPKYGFLAGQSKYHALNLIPLGLLNQTGIGTIEVRGLRPQRDAQDLADQVLMLHCRAKMLNDLAARGILVAYKGIDYRAQVGRTMPTEDDNYDRPDVLHAEATNELEDYLENAGLPFNVFKRLMQFA